LEKDGIGFGIVFIEGLTKDISKTYCTKFASCEDEGKKDVSSKKVTLADK